MLLPFKYLKKRNPQIIKIYNVSKYGFFRSNFKHLKYNSLLFLLEVVRLDLMFHLDATSNFLND